MKLTEKQIEIINAPYHERTLVNAGPGTGKTEVVARRLAYLLDRENLTPGQILVLSFSRSAVKALIKRIRSINEETETVEDLRYLTVRTFDSWSFRILRFLGEEPAHLLKNKYDKNISLLIKKLLTFERADLLNRPELRFSKIRHVIVDEYQDLTGVRAKLVNVLLKLLAPYDVINKDDHLCGFTILGDPHQAIYDWILNNSHEDEQFTSRDLISWLKEKYSDNLILKPLIKNHRSTSKIADLVVEASRILEKCDKSGSNPFPEFNRLIEDLEFEDSEDITDDILSSDPDCRLAILCRDNSQIIKLCNELRNKLPPEKFRLISIAVGDPPASLPPWIAIMLHEYKTEQLTKRHFLKIFNYLQSSGSFNSPCNGDPEAAWQMLMKFARQSADEKSISMKKLRERLLWPDSLPDDEEGENYCTVITTIHQAKGLEFDSVKLVECDDGGEDTGADEEGRVFFVGISRASEELALVEIGDSYRFSKRKFNNGDRNRWYRAFKKGFSMLEVGQECDYDPQSIISEDLLESRDNVETVQNLLAEHEQDLLGSELVLKKTKLRGDKWRFVYNIWLENFNEQNYLLGRTTELFTKDLLDIKHHKQYLPKNIYGLHIKSVTTLTCNEITSPNVSAPWNHSRLWLGINFHGIGRFKFYWKNKY